MIGLSWTQQKRFDHGVIQKFFRNMPIVIHAQIECEIDIRMLTSRQVFGQIFDQSFG